MSISINYKNSSNKKNGCNTVLFVDEKFATQYKDKGKLSKTDAPGSRHDHTHDVDPRMADYVPKGKVRKSSTALPLVVQLPCATESLAPNAVSNVIVKSCVGDKPPNVVPNIFNS